MNKAIPLPTQLLADIGSKTDLLYNCLHPSGENGGTLDLGQLQRAGVKMVCSPYPRIRPFAKDIARYRMELVEHLPLHVVDVDFYQRVSAALGCRPNTGVMAILDLLRFDLSKLERTGLTFFRDGYFPSY